MHEYEGTVLAHLPPESIGMCFREIPGEWTRFESTEFAGNFTAPSDMYEDPRDGTLEKYQAIYTVRHDGRVIATIRKDVGLRVGQDKQPYYYATGYYPAYEVGVEGHVDVAIDQQNQPSATLRFVAVLPVGALSDPDLYLPEEE